MMDKRTIWALNIDQRKTFIEKWRNVSVASGKWYQNGQDTQRGVKALEEEINDLERLSIAAYSAMKYLKSILEANDTGSKPTGQLDVLIKASCGHLIPRSQSSFLLDGTIKHIKCEEA